MNRRPPPTHSGSPKLYEVSEIETLVFRCLEKHTEGPLRIKGEVSNVRSRSGERPWFSFDLVEFRGGDVGSIHAFLGAEKAVEIQRRLTPAEATIEDLIVEGHELVVTAAVHYDARYHRVELLIDSIDADWTFGWLDRTRSEFRARLLREGLHRRQSAWSCRLPRFA